MFSQIKTKTLLYILFLSSSIVVLPSLITFATNTFNLGWGGGGDYYMNAPSGIAVNSDGDVFVVEKSNHRVKKFNADGTFVVSSGIPYSGSDNGKFDNPEGAVVDASGNVYVVDEVNNRVQKLNSNLTYVSKFGTTGSGNGQLSSPRGIAIDINGNIYVTEHGNGRVQKFDSSGNYVAKWGNFGSVRGVAVDSDLNVYVADAGMYRVQKFDSGGNLIATIGGTEGSAENQFDRPWGVAIDPTNNHVYVADFGRNRIQHFDSSGAFVDMFGWGVDDGSNSFQTCTSGCQAGTSGSGDGQLASPAYLAFSQDGAVLYVTNQDVNRVQSFVIHPAAPSVKTSNATNLGYTTATLNGRILSTRGADATVRGFQWGPTTAYGATTTETGTLSAGSFNSTIDGLTRGNTYHFRAYATNMYGTTYGSDKTFVADFLFKFSSQWGNLGGGASDFGIDNAGGIYTTDSNTYRIRKFFNEALVSQTPAMSSIVPGLGVDGDGNQYVPEVASYRVTKFDSNSNFVMTFGWGVQDGSSEFQVCTSGFATCAQGSMGSGDGQFFRAQDVAVDSVGNIYVLDQVEGRVQKFGPDGSYITKWGSSGSGDNQLDIPMSITIDPSDNVYILEVGGPYRVKKYSSDGTFLLKWGSSGTAESQFMQPRGVNAGLDGNIYVADSENSRVQQFSPTGAFIAMFGWGVDDGSSEFQVCTSGCQIGIPASTGYGQFNSPRAIQTDSNGRVKVLDSQPIQTFLTRPLGPEVVTLSPTLITTNSVTLNGNVVISDGEPATEWGFRWGTTTAYGATTTIPGSITSGLFSTSIDGLVAGRRYHYQAYAKNSYGLGYATDTPFAATFIANGNPYVSVTGYGTQQPASGFFGSINALAIDSHDNLFVADGGNYRVSKFDSAGNTLTSWGSFGIEITNSFRALYNVALDSNDNVYIADGDIYRLLKYDSSGHYLNSSEMYIGQAEGQVGRKDLGLAIGSSDALYVADMYNYRIQKFDSTLAFQRTWGYGVSNGSNAFQICMSSCQAGTIGSNDGQFEDENIDIAADKNSGQVYSIDRKTPRIQAFDSNGNFLFKWGSQGSGEGQFSSPAGVAVDNNGFVYVTDRNNYRVQKFNSSGTYVSSPVSVTSGSGPGQSKALDSIAIDSSGNIYISDATNRTVQKFSSSGSYLGRLLGINPVGNGQFRSLSDMVQDSSGNVYATDPGNGLIQKFDANGRFIKQWGVSLSGNGGGSGGGGSGGGSGNVSSNLTSIAIGPNNRLYVVDIDQNSVDIFDTDGNLITVFGGTGTSDGQFTIPDGIDVDNSGNVYVADKLGYRIQKFDAAGNFITKWGTWGRDEGYLSNPAGVAVAPNNNIYVVDQDNDRVSVFTNTGSFVKTFGSSQYAQDSLANGEFNLPTDIYIDDGGNVYVVDQDGNRIQKFDLDGNFIARWGTNGTELGQFSYPSGIAGNGTNLVHVADTGNNRIQTFTMYNVTPSTPPPQSGGSSGWVSVNVPEFAQAQKPATLFTRDLSIRMSGADVLTLQKFLNNHGFVLAKSGVGSPGKETTTFGTLTQQALIKFQKKYNLKQTGVLNDQTKAVIELMGLNVSPVPVSALKFDRDLQLHDEGNDVLALQKYLNSHGYVVSETGSGSLGNETTTFGVKTKEALKKYQKDRGIPQTGVLGPLTRKALTTQ